MREEKWPEKKDEKFNEQNKSRCSNPNKDIKTTSKKTTNYITMVSIENEIEECS